MTTLAWTAPTLRWIDLAPEPRFFIVSSITRFWARISVWQVQGYDRGEKRLACSLCLIERMIDGK
ncbi:hypothetical protein CKO51_08660 [Rhodopirellula sp. SM50]|nr:hypothetical protein CKO51_08660 [Rhodopirellula sp. SM50]